MNIHELNIPHQMVVPEQSLKLLPPGYKIYYWFHVPDVKYYTSSWYTKDLSRCKINYEKAAWWELVYNDVGVASYSKKSGFKIYPQTKYNNSFRWAVRLERSWN